MSEWYVDEWNRAQRRDIAALDQKYRDLPKQQQHPDLEYFYPQMEGGYGAPAKPDLTASPYVLVCEKSELATEARLGQLKYQAYKFSIPNPYYVEKPTTNPGLAAVEARLQPQLEEFLRTWTPEPPEKQADLDVALAMPNPSPYFDLFVEESKKYDWDRIWGIDTGVITPSMAAQPYAHSTGGPPSLSRAPTPLNPSRVGTPQITLSQETPINQPLHKLLLPRAPTPRIPSRAGTPISRPTSASSFNSLFNPHDEELVNSLTAPRAVTPRAQSPFLHPTQQSYAMPQQVPGDQQLQTGYTRAPTPQTQQSEPALIRAPTPQTQQLQPALTALSPQPQQLQSASALTRAPMPQSRPRIDSHSPQATIAPEMLSSQEPQFSLQRAMMPAQAGVFQTNLPYESPEAQQLQSSTFPAHTSTHQASLPRDMPGAQQLQMMQAAQQSQDSLSDATTALSDGIVTPQNAPLASISSGQQSQRLTAQHQAGVQASPNGSQQNQPFVSQAPATFPAGTGTPRNIHPGVMSNNPQPQHSLQATPNGSQLFQRLIPQQQAGVQASPGGSQQFQQPPAFPAGTPTSQNAMPGTMSSNQQYQRLMAQQQAAAQATPNGSRSLQQSVSRAPIASPAGNSPSRNALPAGMSSDPHYQRLLAQQHADSQRALNGSRQFQLPNGSQPFQQSPSHVSTAWGGMSQTAPPRNPPGDPYLQRLAAQQKSVDEFLETGPNKRKRAPSGSQQTSANKRKMAASGNEQPAPGYVTPEQRSSQSSETNPDIDSMSREQLEAYVQLQELNLLKQRARKNNTKLQEAGGGSSRTPSSGSSSKSGHQGSHRKSSHHHTPSTSTRMPAGQPPGGSPSNRTPSSGSSSKSGHQGSHHKSSHHHTPSASTRMPAFTPTHSGEKPRYIQAGNVQTPRQQQHSSPASKHPSSAASSSSMDPRKALKDSLIQHCQTGTVSPNQCAQIEYALQQLDSGNASPAQNIARQISAMKAQQRQSSFNRSASQHSPAQTLSPEDRQDQALHNLRQQLNQGSPSQRGRGAHDSVLSTPRTTGNTPQQQMSARQPHPSHIDMPMSYTGQQTANGNPVFASPQNAVLGANNMQAQSQPAAVFNNVPQDLANSGYDDSTLMYGNHGMAATNNNTGSQPQQDTSPATFNSPRRDTVTGSLVGSNPIPTEILNIKAQIKALPMKNGKVSRQALKGCAALQPWFTASGKLRARSELQRWSGDERLFTAEEWQSLF